MLKQNNLILIGFLCLFACGNGKDPKTGNQTNNPDATSEKTDTETTDEQEPNNSAKQANTLEPGKTIRGTMGPPLKNAGDADWFLIKADKKMRIKATLTGVPNIDLFITIFHGEGDQPDRLVTINNQGPGEGETAPVIGLLPGRNYLRVKETEKKGKTPSSDEVNPYTVKIEVLPDAPEEEVEPNDNKLDATELTPGKEEFGYFAWKDDVDWYKIPTAGVEPGSLMRIDFKGVPNVTPQLTLYDSIEAKIWGPVTHVKSEETLTFRNIAVQTGKDFEAYYIAIASKKGTNIDERYTLAVSFEKGNGDTELEPNDDRKRATPIGNRQRLSGTISQGDVDFYKVVADAPAILRVDVEGIENVDLRLEVYNSEGQKTFGVNEGPKKAGEIIPDVAIPMGESFVKVFGGKGESNNDSNYVIEVTLASQDGTMEIEPNNSKEEATEIAPGLTLSGYLFPQKDIDVYRLDLSTRAGITGLQISVTGILKVDLELSLLDDAGVVMQSSAKKPEGEEEVLKGLTLEPGVYQIVVKGKGSNPRDTYQLRVEER